MDWTWFLFSLKGRISRRQYWLNFILPVFALSLLIALLFMPNLETLDAAASPPWPVALWSLALFWPSIATQVKRWHDRDKSGWWYLINFVPFVGGLWALVETGFLAGSAGANRFGPDPRQGGRPQA